MRSTPSVPPTRRFLVIAAFGLVALGLGLVVGLRDVPVVGSGWVAKRVCSTIFVARRPLSLAPEIGPPISLPFSIPYAIDETKRTVRATLAGHFAPSTARFRPGLGCTLDPADGSPAALGAREIAPRARPEALPTQAPDPGIEAAIDVAFADAAATRGTRALVAIHRGRVVGERYAPGFAADMPLTGWSMTKSVTGAMVGLLADAGRIDPDAPIGLAEWSADGDPRAAISWDHLLRMSSGLAFSEDYALPTSDAVQMLFGRQRTARGRYGATRPLEYPIDTHWSYSSGTTNVLQYAMLERVFAGDVDAYLRFPHDALFGPVGMASAVLEPDASGVYVGSSHMYATARDWARFGLVFLNQGRVGDRAVLSRAWVDYSVAPTPTHAGGHYGAQWWLNADPVEGTRRFPKLAPNVFMASGFEGQYIVVVPDDDLVVVRLGLDLGEPIDIEGVVATIVGAVRAKDGA